MVPHPGSTYFVLKFMKRAYTFLTAIVLTFTALAQSNGEEESFRSSMIEGTQLMEEFSYSVALDIWLDLLKKEPDHANVNYKAGVCLWKLPKRRHESLPYFVKAVKNVTERFDPYAPNEKGAPVEAYFYIAQAFHLHYDLDSAIAYYNEFKSKINGNHEFWSRTALNIQQCETAKEMILDPVDIEVINLGPLVNSKYPDYAPVISVDESALYFTSKRLRKDSSNLYAKNPNDGDYYDDIYVSYKGEDNAWGEPEMINFNTSDNEATLSLSADGETMYIYKAAANGNGDIYTSTLAGNTWSDPVPVGSDINSEDHESHAAVSPDGSRLYFISDRDGSLKFPDKAHEKVESKDIYFCNKLPTNEWALAQPLKELNTVFNEEAIFLHPDGKTLFFSSEGHKSMGGYDIFTSEMDDNGVWGEPKNIGYPLNTTDNDIFFVTSTSGKRGYYSSTRDDGFGDKDIYVISMLSFKEKPLTLLIGKIKTSDGSKLPEGIFIYVRDNETGEDVGTYKPRARDDVFTMIIQPGSDYHLEYTYNDSIFYEDDIFVPENSAYQEINKGISLGAVKFASFGETKKETVKEPAAPVAKVGSEQPSVEGRLQYGSAGAAGVALKLKDDSEETIGTTTTDGSGNFEFKNLAAGSSYYVMIDAETGEVPDNAQLFIKDQETGTMLPVSKMANGSFKFETLPSIEAEELKLAEEEEPQIAYGAKHPSVEGNLKYGAVGAAGVPLKLKDGSEKTIGSTTTDDSGNFEFKNLGAGSSYYVMIDAETGEIPDNAQLFIKDQGTGTMLPVSKMANGSFKFETLPYMETEELSVVEEKEEKAEKIPAYKTEVKHVDGENYIVHQVKDGESFFSISVLYNLKFDYISAANKGVGDLIYAGDEILVPIPEDVMFFFEFFDYGILDIDVNSQDFKNFAVQVEKAVNERGSAKLMIETSASKVPTTKDGGNEAISGRRAELAQKALASAMQAKGIGPEKLNYASISTLVRGPEFQDDASENRATYKNFQYVKIIVK